MIIPAIRIPNFSRKVGGGGGTIIPFLKPTAIVKPSPEPRFFALHSIECSESILAIQS
ncbi:hypothetical protein AB670_00322 [Chryseobacterium sp. MOF25P]|nr:hypothetical protein AB670_00322 [Chryseobacterium sp. MOF25P]OBW47299.1 hypothetical protein AB671_00510 [Chryseobacterium sp. BGARF1]